MGDSYIFLVMFKKLIVSVQLGVEKASCSMVLTVIDKCLILYSTFSFCCCRENQPLHDVFGV